MTEKKSIRVEVSGPICSGKTIVAGIIQNALIEAGIPTEIGGIVEETPTERYRRSTDPEARAAIAARSEVLIIENQSPRE